MLIGGLKDVPHHPGRRKTAVEALLSAVPGLHGFLSTLLLHSFCLMPLFMLFIKCFTFPHLQTWSTRFPPMFCLRWVSNSLLQFLTQEEGTKRSKKFLIFTEGVTVHVHTFVHEFKDLFFILPFICGFLKCVLCSYKGFVCVTAVNGTVHTT